MPKKRRLETSPLYEAAHNGYESEVRRLLDAGEDPNSTDCRGWPALYAAAQERREEIVKLLISHDADVNYVNGIKTSGPGWPIVGIAAHYDEPHVIRCLCEHGADPNNCGEDVRSPLYIAADRNSRSAAKALLDAGADPKLGLGEETPLQHAKKCGHDDVASLLRSRG